MQNHFFFCSKYDKEIMDSSAKQEVQRGGAIQEYLMISGR